VASALSGGGHGQWRALRDEAGALIFHQQRGERRERWRFDPVLARSPEARRLADALGGAAAAFAAPASFHRKDQTRSVTGPLSLVEAVLEAGRKGLQIQRYKGLGEMNPSQLWETTLDPERRVLLQVKIEHADEADEIFATLMGDVVDPRREFIQDNALKVVNLDV
jgi:DNA gyrase subunit B